MKNKKANGKDKNAITAIISVFAIMFIVPLALAFTQSNTNYDMSGEMPYIAGEQNSTSFSAIVTASGIESSEQNSSSFTMITGAVAGTAPFCGDNIVDANEDCDGTNMDGQTCQNNGYDYGQATCSATCKLDLSKCTRWTGGGGSSRGGSGISGGTLPSSYNDYGNGVSRLFGRIMAGEIYSVSTNDKIFISEVEFSSLIDALSVNVQIMEISNPGLPSYESRIYKYAEITIERLSGNINQSTIYFNVEKSWMKANDVDNDEIVLLRFANNAWQELTTTFIKEDEVKSYFKAENPDFSYFAVGIKRKPVVEPIQVEIKETVKEPVIEEPVKEITEPVDKVSAWDKVKGWLGDYWMYLAIAVGAIILLVPSIIFTVAMARRRHEDEGKAQEGASEVEGAGEKVATQTVAKATEEVADYEVEGTLKELNERLKKLDKESQILKKGEMPRSRMTPQMTAEKNVEIKKAKKTVRKIEKKVKAKVQKKDLIQQKKKEQIKLEKEKKKVQKETKIKQKLEKPVRKKEKKMIKERQYSEGKAVKKVEKSTDKKIAEVANIKKANEILKKLDKRMKKIHKKKNSASTIKKKN